jgi:cyclophilin family peptidyl-prolyl cis-trans isomerase
MQKVLTRDQSRAAPSTAIASAFTFACVLFWLGASGEGFAQSPQTPAPAPAPPALSYGEIIEKSAPSDWRTPLPENVVYLELRSGRVVLELSPHFAPNTVANIRTLIRDKYFDGGAIIRSQDNYVVQWANRGDDGNARDMKGAAKKVAPEWTRKLLADDWTKFAFDTLPDRDGYAPQVGFASGFWAGRNPMTREVWPAHCYGTLGVGRGNEPDSGNGTELYVVTGHAPRHLDRNITLVGRVLQGMPLLSSLPRGSKALGFYATKEENVPIKSIRLAADVPVAERTNLEVIRTDTETFKRAVEALRNRGGGDPNAWFKVPAGHVELCNVPIAVREKK